jgi:predicted alpha/beta hydrolase family esterase
MKRAIVVHGWDDNPKGSWFPWLKRELEKRGFEVLVPRMPHPHRPTIKDWVKTLSLVVGKPDNQTIFVGHSIGCQTILRYLARLPSKQSVRGVVLVAPWIDLTDAAIPVAFYRKTAQPWLQRPIPWSKIQMKAKQFIAIASIDDQYVPIRNHQIFKKHLHAKGFTTKGGHLGSEDGVRKLPVVLQSIQKLSA